MWILVVLMLTVDGLYTEQVGVYQTIDECFDMRELVVEELGRPIVNYQAVCVQYKRSYE